MPRSVKRTGQPLPNFLWDKTALALGVKRSATRHPVFAEREHAAFRDLHRRLLADCDDDAVRAFLRFLDRWRPDDYRRLRHADEMLDANVVFRLGGELGFLHDRTSVKRIWSDHLEESGGAEGRCLVTGERASIARLHPSVKGIAGAQSSPGRCADAGHRGRRAVSAIVAGGYRQSDAGGQRHQRHACGHVARRMSSSGHSRRRRAHERTAAAVFPQPVGTARMSGGCPPSAMSVW